MKPAACQCCGRDERHADVRPLTVESLGNGETVKLPLCSECRGQRAGGCVMVMQTIVRGARLAKPRVTDDRRRAAWFQRLNISEIAGGPSA